MEEVYDLLSKHYVEDDDNLFRFDYPRAFLKWFVTTTRARTSSHDARDRALLAPGWRREYHIGVRVKTTKKLIALITAIPCRTRLYDK
jgi:glycylpeptide N-tetradecanoyltransferase